MFWQALLEIIQRARLFVAVSVMEPLVKSFRIAMVIGNTQLAYRLTCFACQHPMSYGSLLKLHTLIRPRILHQRLRRERLKYIRKTRIYAAARKVVHMGLSEMNDQDESIVNGFVLTATQHAYSLPAEVHRKFRKQRREGQHIAPGLTFSEDGELINRLRESKALSTIPISVYLKAEKTEITKIGDSFDRPIYWLGSFGLYVMAENENSTWEINLSFPAYPPGW